MSDALDRDPVVIAAQGTVGLEFAAEAPDVTDVLVSVSGGGLIELTSIVTTLSAPAVSPLAPQHVSTLVEDNIVVSDVAAVRGSLTLAEEAKLWTEPAAGCLVPAAQRLLDRLGHDARLGLVVCGGNVTATDVRTWVDRFGTAPMPAGDPVGG